MKRTVREGGRPVFWLVRSVNQKPDPSVLPSMVSIRGDGGGCRENDHRPRAAPQIVASEEILMASFFHQLQAEIASI